MKARRGLAVAAIAAASAAAGAALEDVPVLGRLAEEAELTTLDWRVRSVPPRPADESRVVLVLFDSAAAREWPYRVPFPRAHVARVVDAVAAAGPAAIGLDVYLDRRYPALDALDGGDALLRDAIARAGNVVLATGTETGPGGRRVMPVDPYFAEVAAGIGTADLPTPYETVRDAALTVRADGRLVPGFALALYAQAHGMDVDSLLGAADARGSLGLRGLPPTYARIRADRDVQPVPLLFVGPPSRTGEVEGEGDADAPAGAFPAVSSSVVEAMGDFAPEFLFRDRIVLIGSGHHFEERFRTPFYDLRDAEGRIAGWTYGVEVHANALENQLTGRFPRPLPRPAAWALLLAGALAVALASFRGGIAWGGAAAALLVVGNVAAAFLVFGHWTLVLPVVAPTVALGAAFLGSASWLSIVEGREKRAIRTAFSKYVSPELVAEMVADPSRLKLGGEKRPLTILFSDLAGFTSLAETTDPEELLHLLNEYLDAMAETVLAERGMLDKYIGDAVMALFGAPTQLPGHAARACRTALRMQRRLDELNAAWAAGRWPRLRMRMRIGINTGTPVVGNVGGRERFDYTALGDAVNLAARLEPACKTYGVGIMISGETRRAAGDEVVVRELEVLAVYGKAEPVPVFELVAMAGEDIGEKAEVLERYARGLEAYRRRDWEMARVYFASALEADPADGPSALYLDRCDALLAAPPPADWSYVERRQVK